MKITIPGLSTSNAITFCRTLQECKRDDIYFFDVSSVNNYEPLPMLLTAAAIRQFCAERELSPADIQLRFTENGDYQLHAAAKQLSTVLPCSPYHPAPSARGGLGHTFKTRNTNKIKPNGQTPIRLYLV